jgi:stage III sporulation protein SpoIIIAA
MLFNKRTPTELNPLLSVLEEVVPVLPSHMAKWVMSHADKQLVEIVMDYGCEPQVRFAVNNGYDFVCMEGYTVTHADIQALFNHHTVSNIHDNNRAGIEGTLHRISAIRDRAGVVVGLTFRIGRIVDGTTDIILDLLEDGKSILFVGKPGVGKTSKLREACRILANVQRKRVVIVDSSNEIAGESAKPHASVGASRRLMVPHKPDQVRVMVEAVENHMPEVVVVDEISLQSEANAARTINERGVQLLATCHGETLENVLRNPPLSMLVGNVKSVTLGDEEAKKRGTSKTISEREYAPVFDVVVELIDFNTVAIHHDVEEAVDALLRGAEVLPEIRESTGYDDYVVLQRSAVTHKVEPVIHTEYTPRRDVAPYEEFDDIPNKRQRTFQNGNQRHKTQKQASLRGRKKRRY